MSHLIKFEIRKVTNEVLFKRRKYTDIFFMAQYSQRFDSFCGKNML